MNRYLIAATLALAVTGGSLAQDAQKPAAVLEHAAKGTVVFDDDGGRAQIIPRQPAESRDATFHGGPVVSGANVQAVFLGNGWRDRSNRDKEGQAIAALRESRGTASSLAQYGLKAWAISGQPLEDPAGDPVAGRTISDLEIQGRLDSLLGGAGPLDPKAVFVVFLAPGLGSTLGAKSSAQDFAAYHNHLHSASGVFHYVVVPYDENASRWISAARQSLHQALINPEGDGWY
ncbi:MAG TPA: hypothetical protein VGG20_17670 [Thermoanaerobaculia bacterium]|jgi:hypothetical protein